MPINPAYVMQGRSDHPAQLFRMALAGVALRPTAVGATSPGGGVNPMLGQVLAVSGLASMNVSVGTGLVYIPATTAWQGMYAGFNTTTYNVAIPSSSSTQWRRDYIAAVVTDPGDNTAAWDIVDVEGTFSSTSPGSLPALPANSVPLGIVNVVPNMTVTNGSGTVSDARIYEPLPGVWQTTSSAKPPTNAPEGTTWFETDTNRYGVLVNGTYNYLVVAPQAPDTWHDLRPASVGFNGSNANEYPPQYRITPDGTRVEFTGGVGLPNSSINGTNVFQNALPATYRPNHHTPIPAVCSNGQTCLFNILTNGMIQVGGFSGSGAGVIAYFVGSFARDSAGVIQS